MKDPEDSRELDDTVLSQVAGGFEIGSEINSDGELELVVTDDDDDDGISIEDFYGV